MSTCLHLKIATPAQQLVDNPSVRLVRATDSSGSFGILPGHTNLITVLTDSVVRWRGEEGRYCYCALRGGVLIVDRGVRVRIACREGLVDEDLDHLEALVEERRAAETDADREEAVRQLRLHTQAMRQIMSYLHPDDGNVFAETDPGVNKHE